MQRMSALKERERRKILQNRQAEFQKLTKTPNPRHTLAPSRVSKDAEDGWINVERESERERDVGWFGWVEFELWFVTWAKQRWEWRRRSMDHGRRERVCEAL